MRNSILNHFMLRARCSRFWALTHSLLFVSVVAILPRVLVAQTAQSYTVLSVKPDEVIIRIEPKYTVRTVPDANGSSLTELTFPGGILTDSSGAPEAWRLPLSFLAPNHKPAAVKILRQSTEVLSGVTLAPVPTYTRKDGDVLKQYLIRDDRYYSSAALPLIEVQPVSRFRTAFSERILVSPIQYDPQSKTVTRIKSLTIAVRFSDAFSAASSNTIALSNQESELFRSLFLNGTETSFYTVSAAEWPAEFQKTSRSKTVALSEESSSTQWLQITTTDAGVYRITAQDLANNGISGPIDPNSIELFGTGGEMLSEPASDSSGEWIERAIDVHTNGQNFTELYFYANGPSVWQYSSGLPGLDGLYHILNPYTSTGHFLLKVGGAPLSSAPRIATQADSNILQPVSQSEVLSAMCHEVDRILETGAGNSSGEVGREMLDQQIPRDGAGSLNVSLDPPGYLSDYTTMRVAYDAIITSPDGSPPTMGFITVNVDNQLMEYDTSSVNGVPARNWNQTVQLSPSLSAPLNVGMTFTSTDIAANAWLDFIELIYHRSTSIGSQSIPFFLIDTNAAFTYQFSGATGGAVWDITNPVYPHIVATASGDAMPVSLQGEQHAMREFIAYSSQSVLTPAIASITAPSLRTGICQSGADEIIVTPQAFLGAADSLAQLREMGGQATEPMSAAVVTIEQIYQEFGYGNKDIVALRDFMSYMFHHASHRPSYLTLLGNGHCDYQNHQTQTPNYIPQWEGPMNPMSEPVTFRNLIVESPYPDDGFFVQLNPNEGPQTYDVAVGRVTARDDADAEGFVNKIQHYEHGSDTGAWRSVATFLSDDHWDSDLQNNLDPLHHIENTEEEVTHLQTRVVVNKIYEVAYPTEIIAGGYHRKPDVNTAIIDAFNNGSVLFSFIGHGNPNVWTHEAVLNVPSSINQMTNFDRLSFVTTATCDFSVDDDFTDFSGGEQFFIKPDGGAIGMLGTTRSVTDDEPLVQSFYQTLFQQVDGHGTSTTGEALLAGKRNGDENYIFFYLLGDPAERLLLPKLYVSFDSINGVPLGSDAQSLPALSTVHLSGSIRDDTTSDASMEPNFNGMVTVTLYDTPDKQSATSVFPAIGVTIHDAWMTSGPILFRGSATVTNGKFSINFIVPRDLKLDSARAKLSGYAYSGSDNRTALGDNQSITLAAPDSATASIDTTGPSLQVWLGSRTFQSGDIVSMNSTIIVDVSDLHGLNTSTASIGHSFIAWVDDAMDSAVDLSGSYVSKENDFSSGTSEQPIELPAGHHTLHVRAFDTYDNPTFASVDFVAKKDNPYDLYNVSVVPDPLADHTTISFMQPGNAGSLINATVSIYEPSGQLVRTLQASSSESVIEIPWDARDNNGGEVQNGAYVFVINAQDVTDGTSSIATGKCIVTR